MTRELLIAVDRIGMRTVLADDGKLISYDFEQRRSVLGRTLVSDEATAGSIWRARVEKVVPGMHAAFLNLGQPVAPQAFLSAGELVAGGSKVSGRPDVASVVSAGSSIVVQVIREAQGQKGPRVTMSPSFTGAYAILSPFDARLSGAARSMPAQHKARLKELVAMLERVAAKRMEQELAPCGLVPGTGFAPGVVLRASAADADEAALAADVEMLAMKWARVYAMGAADGRPGLIAPASGLLDTEVRSALALGVERIVTDDESTRDAVRTMIALIPEHVRPTLTYEVPTAGTDLFMAHGLGTPEGQVLARKVSLPSGTWLSIEPTEALTVIDVNAGHGAERRSLSDKMALSVNLEAADEVARQIIARRISGAVVVDFITLKAHKDRKQVQDRVRQAFSAFDVQVGVGEMSAAGLMEITRRGGFSTLRSRMTGTCAVCGAEGHALVDDVLAAQFERACIRNLSVYPGIARATIGVSERLFALLERPECTVAQHIAVTLGIAVEFCALSEKQRSAVVSRVSDPIFADLAFEVLSRSSV